MVLEDSDEWLRHQLRELNRDIPKIRVPLPILLKMDNPFIETLGGVHYFDKDELKSLKSILPEDLQENLKLPLVFRRSIESGESIYFIDGGELEAEVIKKLTGLNFIPFNGEKYYTYKPVILKLLSNFPSIIVIGVI
ncbi:MAG: DUF61 family protein [Aigarchaeota archaeon]|nr:DUF61 family protein [Aigarchaeota archaeon]MDW7986896.1 DUF61 family protein [Nitrososphaerota archaeon]